MDTAEQSTRASVALDLRRDRRRSQAVRGVVLGLATASGAAVAAVASGPVAVSLAIGWALITLVAAGVALRAGRRLVREHREPDPVAAARVDRLLADLDRVEHRRVELGSPWPLVSVGPTGVSVVDVCPPLPRRRGTGSRAFDARIRRVRSTGEAIERTLRDAGVDLPVRTLAVAAQMPAPVRRDEDAQVLIDLDRLPAVLADGPVVAMALVDAAFTSLTRDPAVAGT